MSKTILEAIQEGNYEFEPLPPGESDFVETSALPGTVEKVDILAERIKQGLPLWHPSDRQYYNDDDGF